MLIEAYLLCYKQIKFKRNATMARGEKNHLHYLCLASFNTNVNCL